MARPRVRSALWLFRAFSLATAIGINCAPVHAADHGNRLAHLNTSDPYYPNASFARLVTPQWVGETGVDAVVVLSIDDMRGYEKWEAYLRPILNRLKAIDGRAPVSIMTCSIDPKEPHLQKWLAEGVSLEVHTVDHPCPLLEDGDLLKARSTFERCVDLMTAIPSNRPVAFRTPCCDSLNTLSPRFFGEIFEKTTSNGNFLAIDSSVFNVLTPRDTELPSATVVDADGSGRFEKYLPFPSFVNTIENYPYPYVIGNACWEFPCAVPSDWEAQNLHRPNNPTTVDDLKHNLDATVAKQGVLTFVFHPHGWIRNDQIVDFVDYTVATYGTRVRFLSFADVYARLNRHLLSGQPLRDAHGGDNGVRVLDVNHDGFQDVVIANAHRQETRVWDPADGTYRITETPVSRIDTNSVEFGVFDEDGRASIFANDEGGIKAWTFDAGRWRDAEQLSRGLSKTENTDSDEMVSIHYRLRFSDIDGDGRCEAIRLPGPESSADAGPTIFRWEQESNRWHDSGLHFPEHVENVDFDAIDSGLRLTDLDEDGQLDVIFSNERGFGAYLFRGWEHGWSVVLREGDRGDGDAIPMIARNGRSNGAWMHSGHLWVQNEDTARLPDLVDRLAIADLLSGVEPVARSPERSRLAIHTKPGFHVELVAAEPLVQDPVAIDWGPDGRLWVAEMADYPSDDEGKAPGRVRFLEDVDGDGTYDRSTVFLDNIPTPNGVMSWREGILVSAAPDILYAADTDGDGHADVRRVVLTGFGEGNPQHRVNGFRWGLDNWIYAANGDSGGTVTSDTTGEPLRLGPRDFRFRPDDGTVEAIPGQTQFQRVRDDWGNWFGNNNSNPMWQYLGEPRYLDRNPLLVPPPGRLPVAEVPGVARVYPRSRLLERFNDLHTANHFTSACSAVIYRDELLGPQFAGNTFVCEPVHNLVHREVAYMDGLRVRSRRADDELRSEFLASSDHWFRPVMVRTGPDGGLWVVDMYRHVIEHTEWIPDDYEARVDVRGGAEMGRIYRVLPVGVAGRAVPNLAEMTPEKLVAALDSPNGWQRDKAHQLLVERGGTAAVGPLVATARSSNRALARLHAICALDGLNAYPKELVGELLSDPHPGVRRHAVRISEPFLEEDPNLVARLARMTKDEDEHVRRQVAYSLGETRSREAGEALVQMGMAATNAPYQLAAVLSSAVPHLEVLVHGVLATDAPPAALCHPIVRLAVSRDVAVDQILKHLFEHGGSEAATGSDAGWKMVALAELIAATNDQGDGWGNLLERYPEFKGQADAMLLRARDTLTSTDRTDDVRAVAVRLVAASGAEDTDTLELLAELVQPNEPQTVREIAMAALSNTRDDSLGEVLVDRWRGFDPEARKRFLALLLGRRAWTESLLGGLEQGVIRLTELDAAARQRLSSHRDSAVQARAEAILGSIGENRAEALSKFDGLESHSGDASSGAVVFEKRCGVCHALQGRGTAVGPDLAALTNKSTAALLAAILDPNRAVESKFLSYTVLTASGQTFSGLLADESANHITLLGQEGKRHEILRAEIDVLESQGKSLMPEGLEQDISVKEMGDLIAYVQGITATPKSFAGNSPATVQPERLRNELACLPGNAEIFGTSLVFEDANQNLGYWQSEDDHAVWTVDAPIAGEYYVFLEWSCDDSVAGNTCVIEVGEERLNVIIEGTGDWNRFRREAVGRLHLESGQQRVGVRGLGRIDGFLMDLKSLTLRPVPQ